MAETPTTMRAMVLTGHGGMDRLAWHTDWPVPKPGPGEVLVRVKAASVNNTDINTRIGWYSKVVRGDTNTGGAQGFADIDDTDSSWAGKPLHFPRIQGADICGVIAAVGDGVDGSRIGRRVLIRALQNHPADSAGGDLQTIGSESDGGFAEYTVCRTRDALDVPEGWSDLDLASIPCAWSTAEGMLVKAGVGLGEDVLITGASGGVGSAAIQLVKRRGASVTAMAGAAKADAVKALGANAVWPRGAEIPKQRFDVVVDLVGGPAWPTLLDGLKTGGRYVTSGAIAGPIVELDLRTLYLRDLTLLGSTRQPDHIMPDLITYIARGEITPRVAAVYPLEQLREAQTTFLDKGYVGKIAIRVSEDCTG